MKKKSILICMLIIALNSFSQSCDGFNPLTYSHTTSVWNWTDLSASNWEVFYRNQTGSTPINPPFKTVPSGVFQGNVSFLYEIGIPTEKRDYHPEEGWELVIKHFGQNNSNPNFRVVNPGFVLYNRFRSILRFFVYASPNPTTATNSASVYTRVNRFGDLIPGLFNNSTSISMALDTILKDFDQTTIESPNVFSKFENNWLILDMPVAYDPCVCINIHDSKENKSKLVYGYDEISTSKTVGSLSENVTKPEDIIKNGDYVQYNTDINSNSLISGVKQTVSYFNSVYNAGNKSQKQFEGFSKDFKKISESVYDFIRPQLRDTGLSKDIKWPSAFKTLFETVPYAGMVFGVFNFLTSGGSNNIDYSKYYTGFATPREYSFNAITTTTQPATFYTFYTPGSQYDRATADAGEKPVYDYALGTFQLLETPELEMSVFHDSAIGRGNVNSHVSNNAFSPVLQQFRLKKPLKYIINPASQLTIKKLEVSFEYRLLRNKDIFRYIDTFHTAYSHYTHITSGTIAPFYHPMMGPVFLKQSVKNTYAERLKESGIFILNWPVKKQDTSIDSGFTLKPILKYEPTNLLNATFATQWFNPVLYKDYSFMVGFNPWVSNTNPGTNFLHSNMGGLIAFNNAAAAKGLRFTKQDGYLDVKLKVRAILQRNDANVTPNTEDVVIVQTFDTKLNETIDYGSAGRYLFNIYPSSWSKNLSPGKDYFIRNEVLVPSSKYPVFPHNDYIRYPDTLFINSPITLTKDTIIFARSVILVNSTINVGGNKLIFRAENGVIYGSNFNQIISGNGSLSDEISNVRPGAEIVLQPVSWNEVLNSHCMVKNKYNPIALKSMNNVDNKKLNDISNSYLSIHPNPATHTVNLLLSGYQNTSANIKIFDLMGREMLEVIEKDITSREHSVDLDIERLAPGTYIVKVNNGLDEKTTKLVVVRY